MVKIQKTRSDSAPMKNAKRIAVRVVIVPTTKGRLAVLPMATSKSCSMIWLKAFAEPAARVPPINVATVKVKSGIPRCASTIAGRVETRSNSTTRNFIKARRERDVTRKDTAEL